MRREANKKRLARVVRIRVYGVRVARDLYTILVFKTGESDRQGRRS